MLHTRTVHKDTLSLLKELQQSPEMKACPLADGTALALQLGHRISVDLDFFSPQELNLDEVKHLFEKYSESQELSSSKTIIAWLVNKVKVDVVNYPYPLLFQPINEEGLVLYALPDIVAMKLEAIKGRGRKRDFFDLYFLLKEFGLEEMLEFNNKKFKSNNSFLVLKSLAYFDDAEDDPDIVAPQDMEIPGWEEVKKRIGEAAREYLSK